MAGDVGLCMFMDVKFTSQLSSSSSSSKSE